MLKYLIPCTRRILCGIHLPANTQKASNSWTLWPPRKVRVVGRKPTLWKGQGGKKSRMPYDKRYGITGKDVNETKEGLERGGNEYMRQQYGREKAFSNPAVLQYYDYAQEREVKEMVPEMIPEFVVPDLTDFKLKPYVSFQVESESLSQPKHTPQELFDAIYKSDIGNSFKK